MPTILRRIIDSQRSWSQQFDCLLPEKFIIDGNQDYLRRFVPRYLKRQLIIYDIGSGKSPCVSPEKKKSLAATVVGLDIDERELKQAPNGAYDRTICADVTAYRGRQDADLVICQALLEHVKDTDSAFGAVASILKPGGLALIFVPSRNAVYARVNLLLPERIKNAILRTILPEQAHTQGFPAYYDKCTPSAFRKLAAKHQFVTVEERFYYSSPYFSFFFPAYFTWRLWILFASWLFKEHAAETFVMVLEKRG